MSSKILYSLVFLLLLVFGLSLAGAFNPDEWSFVYGEKTIYKEVMKESCTLEKIEQNGTIHPEVCWEVVDYLVPETRPTNKIIGITDGNDIIYNAYKKNGKIHKWYVPIGDRNFEDPLLGGGQCRQYEIEKGVCESVD